MITYTICNEAELLGKQLAKKYHEHLLKIKVVYLFQDKQDKNGASVMITSGDRNLYGKAKLVSGLNAFLASDIGDEEGNSFFVILITRFSWNYLNKEQKTALVDHELSHCFYDAESGKASMIGHDVEEFTSIIKRHGVWNDGLDKFFAAGRQIKMPFVDPMPVAAAGDAPAGTGDNGQGKGSSKKAPTKSSKKASKKSSKRQPATTV